MNDFPDEIDGVPVKKPDQPVEAGPVFRTDIGIRLRDAIIEGRLFRMECPDSPLSACLCVWSANATDQLEAIVMDYFRDGTLAVADKAAAIEAQP